MPKGLLNQSAGLLFHQNYCFQSEEGVTNDAPELLGRLRPHLDCVTHLETCIHGNRLLLLSASSDCCVALSYLPGHTVGIFGQVKLRVLFCVLITHYGKCILDHCCNTACSNQVPFMRYT